MMFFPPIVFEDEELLIINKPSGLVVNPSETTNSETVSDLVLSYLKVEPPGIGDRAGIVHRLDKDTSGLLIIAKTVASFEKLQSQFKEGMIAKEYTTLVHGVVSPAQGEIFAPIDRNPFNRMRFGVFPGGRKAWTKYKALNFYEHKGYRFTLLEVQPLTGRTHQIRVHLKYIGHSVISDVMYGGRKNIRFDLQFCPRLFLHASRISFIHPKNGERLEFSSKLPNDLKEVLNSLKEVKL